MKTKSEFYVQVRQRGSDKWALVGAGPFDSLHDAQEGLYGRTLPNNAWPQARVVEVRTVTTEAVVATHTYVGVTDAEIVSSVEAMVNHA